MVFQSINIRRVPREVLKTTASGLGFQHLPRDLANVKTWKIIFDPYIIVFDASCLALWSTLGEEGADHFVFRWFVTRASRHHSLFTVLLYCKFTPGNNSQKSIPRFQVDTLVCWACLAGSLLCWARKLSCTYTLLCWACWSLTSCAFSRFVIIST